MSNDDAERFLMGGGGRSAKFIRPGDTVTGTVCAPPALRQRTDITSGKPLTWDNGDPQMQLVVRLQTVLREDPEDDGVRVVYLAGGFARATTQKVVADAVRAAKAQRLEVGGTLALRYTGEEPNAKAGLNPHKLYAAKYDPPATAFLSQPTPAVPAEQPAADPWQQPALTSTGAGWDDAPF